MLKEWKYLERFPSAISNLRLGQEFRLPFSALGHPYILCKQYETESSKRIWEVSLEYNERIHCYAKNTIHT